MFTLIKFLLSVVLVVVLIGGIIYFLPSDLKVKAIEKITGIIPDSIKNKIQDIVLTPPEQRQQIITKLGANLAELKNASSSKSLDTIVSDSEQLLTQLQDKNSQQSLMEIAENKLVDKLIGQSTTTPAQCSN